jgi:hypothetical protein
MPSDCWPPKTVKSTVVVCPHCYLTHALMSFEREDYNTDDWTWYAICPVTKHPLSMVLRLDKPIKTASCRH